MAVTVDQIGALGDSGSWQRRCAAAVYQKATDIVANQGSYTDQQISLARNILVGAQTVGIYARVLAASGNVAVETITYNFLDREVVCSISDASLAGQMYALVFGPLV